MSRRRFTTPFRDLVPRPTDEQFQELKAQLAIEGQRHAVEVSVANEMLDGHTRYEVLGDDVKAVTIKGLNSPEEKRAYVLARASGRHLTPTQEKKRRERQKELARHFQSLGLTHREIAVKLRVSRQWVSKWIKNATRSNDRQIDRPKHNSRSVPAAIQEQVCDLRREGMSADQIADQVKLHRATVFSVLKRHGVEKPKPALGKMPKNLIGRGRYYRDLIANGVGRQIAAAKCGFTSQPQAQRVAQVAENGSPELCDALDAGHLTINKAWFLLSQSKTQQQVAIDGAQATALAKATNHKPAISHDTPKAETLLALLNATYLDWRGFRQNVLGTGKWIPSKGKRAQEIKRKLDTTMAIVESVIRVIRKNQGDTK